MSPKLVLGLRIFMGLCFLALAFCTVYFKEKTLMSEMQAYAFAALLIFYGIFRLYRAFRFSDDVFMEE